MCISMYTNIYTYIYTHTLLCEYEVQANLHTLRCLMMCQAYSLCLLLILTSCMLTCIVYMLLFSIRATYCRVLRTQLIHSLVVECSVRNTLTQQ
jgi:hypothetical protein